MIGAKAWVLMVLRKGYRIPFSSIPPVTSNPIVPRSYSHNSEKGMALDAEERQLLAKGAIEEAP